MAAIKKLLKRLIPVLIILLLVGAGVIIHKKRADRLTHVPREDVAPWALHVAEVSDRPVDSGFPGLAKVSTRQEITIMARISGRILEMGPREGVRVSKSDLLLRVDTREIADKISSLSARLVAARAETRRTRNELQRERKLLKDGGSSKSAVESRRTAAVAAEQTVKSLEHEVSSLKVKQGYGVIKAPADGIIAARLAEPGDMAVPGHPLYKMTASGSALVRVELPQAILHQVQPGTPMVLSHNGQQLTIPISRVFPTVDARALGFVEADIDAIPFDLPSGSRVACRVILHQAKDAVQIPYGSLLCGGDKTACRVARIKQEDKGYVVDMVPVTVQLRGRDGVAVTGALQAKDLVAVAHESVLLQLASGAPVIVARGEQL